MIDIKFTLISHDPKENLEGKCIYSLVIENRLSYECKTDDCKYNCNPLTCPDYVPVPAKIKY